jgi:dihydroflavonol-4-reductase
LPTFVTGGSGFIGTHLVKKLVQRGWQVRALARSDETAEIVAGLGAEVVRGDVSDSQAMLEGMRGCDKVLHVAGVYSTDMQKQNQLIPVNVRGTETVRRAALQTGVERIIYASSIVVLGHTNGMVVDQTYYHRPPWQTQYERSKWLAHRFHTPVFMHPDSRGCWVSRI